MNRQKLNTRLLKWAGFTCINSVWCYPDRVVIEGMPPNFPESLDACVEWLMPKVVAYGYTFTMHSIIYTATNKLGYDVEIKYKGEMVSWADNKDLALALCLAIVEGVIGNG